MNEEQVKEYVENYIDEAVNKAVFEAVQDYATSRDLFNWAKTGNYVQKIKDAGISDGTNPMKLCTRVEVWSYILKLYNMLK